MSLHQLEPTKVTSETKKERANLMTTSSTNSSAQAHGRYIRGSASKVRRVLDQIRGRTYRDALIMLEFMPYRSTEPITKVLRSAVANAEHNLGPVSYTHLRAHET